MVQLIPFVFAVFIIKMATAFCPCRQQQLAETLIRPQITRQNTQLIPQPLSTIGFPQQVLLNAQQPLNQPVLNVQQPIFNQPQPIFSQPQQIFNQPQPIFNQPQPILNQQIISQPSTALNPQFFSPVSQVVSDYTPEMCKSLANVVQKMVLNRLIENSRTKPLFNQVAGPLLSELSAIQSQQGCPVCGSRLSVQNIGSTLSIPGSSNLLSQYIL